MMDFMYGIGFFGTRAPMFMDIVSLIVAFLPFLMFGNILLAKMKKHKLHAKLQGFLYLFSVVVLVYFEIGVRIVGGFAKFMEESSVGHNYAVFVLIFHIFISVVTLIIWSLTIFQAKKQLQLGKHKRFGYATFIGVILTTLTGGWVYMLMFVY